jgi:BTB/POZ domain
LECITFELQMRVQDDLAEKMQSEVTLHDVDLAALQLLVDFAYSGQILITEDNVQVSHINWMILQTLEHNSQNTYKSCAPSDSEGDETHERTKIYWNFLGYLLYPLLCVLD